MILLIDAGNSRVKWSLVAAGERIARGVLASDPAGILAEPWQSHAPEAAVVACVAGAEVRQALATTLERPGLAVHWLTPQAEGHGLSSRYEPPESLGADRYAALLGALRRQAGDCLVVGVGTAATVDVLCAEGVFLGGCIVPGPALMATALAGGTARLGQVAPRWPREWDGRSVPRDTAAAMGEGMLLALRGVILAMGERLAARSRAGGREGGHTVLLHGGARGLLLPFLTIPVVEVEDLVMEGLAWVARDLGYAV